MSKIFGIGWLVWGWFVGAGAFVGTAVAEDWPQWMGPNRDNRWQATQIVTRFPQDGPPVVWRTEVKGGYSGPAVAQGRVIVTDFVTAADVKVSNFDRREFEGHERVICLDAESGEVLWTHEYPVTYSISYPAGPRCTPIIEENRVTTLGAEGHLHCLELETGKVIWSHDFKAKYATPSALWGYANHPLIDGEKLICVVGGQGSHAVAFDKRNGEPLWRFGTVPEQGYSPPTIVEHGGQRQLILMSPVSITAVDPDSGKMLWQEDYEATSGSIIMSPLQVGEFLYVGGYANRNLMLRLEKNPPGVEVLFRDKTKSGIAPVNVQPFVQGDVMYGVDGDGELIAAEIPSGRRLWSTAEPLGDRPLRSGTAFLVKNGDHFYIFTEAGDLVIAQMSPEGFTEVDRAHIIEPTNNAFGRPVVWSAPAFANGRMYVRNDEECVCIELTKLPDTQGE